MVFGECTNVGGCVCLYIMEEKVHQWDVGVNFKYVKCSAPHASSYKP